MNELFDCILWLSRIQKKRSAKFQSFQVSISKASQCKVPACQSLNFQKSNVSAFLVSSVSKDSIQTHNIKFRSFKSCGAHMLQTTQRISYSRFYKIWFVKAGFVFLVCFKVFLQWVSVQSPKFGQTLNTPINAKIKLGNHSQALLAILNQ